MSNHSDLAQRIERAGGPDRALDQEIFAAIGAPVPFQFANKLIALEYNDVEQAYFARVTDDMHVRYAPPHYTASIDAALHLVSEELMVAVVRFSDGRGRANIHDGKNVGRNGIDVRAASPALALCAAALRAKVQQ